MLPGSPVQRAVMVLAALLLVAGAVGAAVWSTPGRSPRPASVPTTLSTTVTTVPGTSVPPTSAPSSPRPGGAPTTTATSPTSPGSAGSAGHPSPSFLAATGFEPDAVALVGLVFLLLGVGLVWIEERTRLLQR